VEAVRAMMGTLLRNVRQVLSAGVAALGGLTLLSPWIALIAAPCLVLAVTAFAVLQRFLVARYRAVVLADENVGATAAPLIDGIRDVAAQAALSRAADEVDGPIGTHARTQRAFARARTAGPPIIALGAYVPLLILLAAAPWLTAHHNLTVGAIVGAVYYLLSGIQPGLQIIVNVGGTVLVHLSVVLNRLAEVTTVPAVPEEHPPSPGGDPTGHQLRVRGLTFAYSEHAEPVISGLDIDVPEGLHLAVVGPSGIGKSTLANLIARLITPQHGKLELGGTALERIDEFQLRTMVALIPQEAYVFAGTLRENLTYLRPDLGVADEGGAHPGDGELDEALHAVGLEQLAARLGGYDAQIPPGGGELTPGERQLIALGRVYVSRASLVILDEATCHLDPATEARAETAFRERDGTLIVIAHRISSALRADQILLMDGAECHLGTHQELLRRNSRYAQLVGHWTGEPAPEANGHQAVPEHRASRRERAGQARSGRQPVSGGPASRSAAGTAGARGARRGRSR
jgi:ATP-binding cassette subfamily C protein